MLYNFPRVLLRWIWRNERWWWWWYNVCLLCLRQRVQSVINANARWCHELVHGITREIEVINCCKAYVRGIYSSQFLCHWIHITDGICYDNIILPAYVTALPHFRAVVTCKVIKDGPKQMFKICCHMANTVYPLTSDDKVFWITIQHSQTSRSSPMM